MPTIITHAVVPIAIRLAAGPRLVPPRLLALGVLATILPDCDVVAFKLGIAYANEFGHRGASHSLLFALVLGLFACGIAPWLNAKRSTAFLFVGFCTASHGLLDMFTNGGLGIAFFWPYTHHRYFFPWQMIEVSPIGVRNAFSARGLAVIRSELFWVWLPALMVGGVLGFIRVVLQHFRAAKNRLI